MGSTSAAATPAGAPKQGGSAEKIKELDWSSSRQAEDEHCTDSKSPATPDAAPETGNEDDCMSPGLLGIGGDDDRNAHEQQGAALLTGATDAERAMALKQLGNE